MTATHRRCRGRRWRGEHRQDGLRFAVGELQAAIAEAEHPTRIAHLRSLRRPVDLSPITPTFLGTILRGFKFYGAPPDPELGQAFLTIEPDLGVTCFPTLDDLRPGADARAFDLLSDDAPTGPIIVG